MHTLFLENEEQKKKKKYRVICFCSIENDMQISGTFAKQRKTLQIMALHSALQLVTDIVSSNQSVIILVINKSDSRFVVVRFC